MEIYNIRGFCLKRGITVKNLFDQKVVQHTLMSFLNLIGGLLLSAHLTSSTHPRSHLRSPATTMPTTPTTLLLLEQDDDNHQSCWNFFSGTNPIPNMAIAAAAGTSKTCKDELEKGQLRVINDANGKESEDFLTSNGKHFNENVRHFFIFFFF